MEQNGTVKKRLLFYDLYCKRIARCLRMSLAVKSLDILTPVIVCWVVCDSGESSPDDIGPVDPRHQFVVSLLT